MMGRIVDLKTEVRRRSYRQSRAMANVRDLQALAYGMLRSDPSGARRLLDEAARILASLEPPKKGE